MKQEHSPSLACFCAAGSRMAVCMLWHCCCCWFRRVMCHHGGLKGCMHAAVPLRVLQQGILGERILVVYVLFSLCTVKMQVHLFIPI